MTLPVSGPLSLSDVLVEIQRVNPSRAAPISLGDADVLALAGKSAPPVSLSDLYGKSSYIPMTITGFNDRGDFDSSLRSGTASCNPRITIAGGSGGYVVSWAFASNPNGCTLFDSGELSCTISHPYVKNALGQASAIVRATVTDSTNHTQTCDVNATLNWSSNA